MPEPTPDPQASTDELIGEFFQILGQFGQTQQDPYSVFTSSFADPTLAVFAGSRLESRPTRAPRRGLGWLSGVGEVFASFDRDVDLDPRVGGERGRGLDWLPDLLGDAARGEGKTVGRKVEDYTKVGDLLKEFYTWDSDKLTEVQKLLYAGGFMGDVSIDAVPWGQPDERTYEAWAGAVTRAARFLQAGEKITIDTVLRRAAKGGFASGRLGAAGEDVTLADPLALSETVDSAAKALLGRKAKPDEQRLFVGLFHDLQRTQGRPGVPVTSMETLEQAIAQPPVEGETTAVSPEARALGFVREQDPTGVAAFSFLERANMFFSALDGID